MSSARRERRIQDRAERKSRAPTLPMEPSITRIWPTALCAGVIGLAGGILLCWVILKGKTDTNLVKTEPNITQGEALRFPDLIEMSPEDISKLDVAEANLLCAKGLPNTPDFEVADYLKTLDEWTARVEAETSRNFRRFKRNPAEYENSEAYYRMGMLVTVVQQDLGVQYNPDLINVPEDADSINHAYLTDPGNVFLTGILGPKRMGTCASMPVLYAAIARRLGYPVKLLLIGIGN